MTWLRCDDLESTHPKLLALDDAAFRLYHHSRLYCAHFLTDGLVPRAALATLTPLRGEALETTVAQLLRVLPPYTAGVWEHAGEDYRVHDYLDYNPTREKVLADRAKETERKARQRKAGAAHVAHARNGRFVARAVSHRDKGGAVPAGVPAGVPPVVPPLCPPLPVPVPVPVTLHGGPPVPGDPATETAERIRPPLPQPDPPPTPLPAAGALQATTVADTPRTPAVAPVKRPGRPGPKSGAGQPALAPAGVSGNGQGGHSGPESGGPSTDHVAAAEIGKGIKRAVDAWYRAFERVHGTKPLEFRRSKDIPILARLVRERGVDEVCTLIADYLETGTQWARKNQAWTVGAFRSQYDKLLALKAEGSL